MHRHIHSLFIQAIILILIALACAPVASQTASGLGCAPANPAFTGFMNRNASVNRLSVNLAAESGLVPEPIDLSHNTGMAPNLLRTLALPTYYDLRTQNRLTAIRDQGGCGSCWAFASIGSLESSLMPGQPSDFSENNLKNLSGFDFGACSGGNRTMASAYMARWAGPVNETADPYNLSNGNYSPPNLAQAASVQDIAFVPDRSGPTDNAAIKQAVMTYGAMYTTYYHDDTCYNPATYSYYYTGGQYANHAVCIVGWDDSYDKTRFKTAAPANGAFIARNSWGTWWGQSGYFYISYYDSNVGIENACYVADPTFPYDTVYQYDTFGWIGNVGYGNTTAWLANVFTAAEDCSLAAASTYAASSGSSYVLYIYRDPTSTPTSGTLAATKAGSMADPGYHTARLDSPVSLTAGQKFAVVMQLTTPGYNYPIPYERPYSGYDSAATASAGQSYISNNGSSWTDITSSYSNTNVCLKAFTSVPAPPPPPSAGVMSVSASGLTATGPAGGSFSPASKVYTLSNTGGTSFTWTASKTASWLTLSSSTGTLAPGGTVTLTATINTGAKSLPAGTYSDTITFSNTTNGSGNTTRTVQLTVTAPVSTYREATATYSWTYAANHTKLSLSDNSVSSQLTMPFTFKFYDQNYTSVYVSSNGFVSFGSTGATTATNGTIPSTATPNAAIYPYWDDLNPTSVGAVRYATVGTAPNRKFVVTWTGVPHHSSTAAKFTFQVALCETSNDILFEYNDMAATVTAYGQGASASIGIENQTGSSGLQHSKNLFGAVSNATAIRYTYH